MIDRPVRLQLAVLTDAEITGLIRVVPGLAACWARVAGADAESLETGEIHARAALRTAMTSRSDQLLASLARAGLESIFDTLDSAESAPDAGEELLELAAIAGRRFGSTAAGLFLSAVSAGSDALAEEVAGRLTELQAVATASCSHSSDSKTAHVSVLSSLLSRTRKLEEAGIALAAALRTAADDIESGKPVKEVERSLHEWSAAVDEQLSNAAGILDAPDLRVLGDGLANMIEREHEKDQELRDALRAIRLLREQGLDHLVCSILAPLGFNRVEQLQAAVSEDDFGAAEVHDDGDLPTSVMTGHAGPEQADRDELEPEQAAIDIEDETTTSADSAVHSDDTLSAEEFTAAEEGAAVEQVRAAEPPSVAERWLPSVAPAAADEAILMNADGQPAVARLADAPGALAGDESLEVLRDLDFPWEIGEPPLLATLISEHRNALAVCLAEAAGESPVRNRLLRFFCAAYSCVPTTVELQLPELSPAEAEVEQMGADECRVLLAAALRVGLALGYSPVGLPSLIDRAELGGNGSRAVIEAAAEAVKRGYRREAEATALQRRDLPREWAAFESEALGLRESLAHGKANLQRASKVLRYIVREDQPVGAALVMVAELSAEGVATAAEDAHHEEWARIEKFVAELSDATTRARLITDADQAVSTKPQLRRAIIAGAWTKLDASVRKVADLLVRFLAVRSVIRLSSRPADLETADELFRTIELQPAGAEITSVGDAAMRQLIDWLRSGIPAADAASLDDLIRAELEPLYEIPRDHEGFPARSPDLPEIREFLSGRDRLEVVRGYLGVGNVTAARRIIAAADDLEGTTLDDLVSQGRRDAQNRHQEALEAVNRVAARLRAVYEDEAARELTQHAEPLRVVPDDRFDLTIGPLRALADRGAAQLRSFRDDLYQRTLDFAGHEADKQRILQLIEDEDEVLAVEFLTMAQAGHELPVVGAQHGDDFSSFFPAMVNAAVMASRAGQDAVGAVRAAAGATADPVNRQLAAGLEAWRVLKTDRRGSSNDRFRARVADVLRMLGLVPPPQTWLQELSRTQRSGFATFKVRAAPLDRSYVPSLGTQAHHTYDLTLVWDAVTPTRLMDFIEESRRTQANIILYFNTLEPSQRLTLRSQTRYDGGKGFSPVVIDEPVVGWLSTRPEPGWRFTQRVTLPFTTINPYTPFAGGEVPDEVFVGREAERQAIEDPTASMFVYGGRQLGKSALLRRVERLFTEAMPARQEATWTTRTGHVAVYLDLKAASVGEAREPAALWSVLAQRLKDIGVFSPKLGRGVRPDDVTHQLAQWLSADDGNRLLLLLDEADNFLTADSQAGRGEVGGDFPTLQRLKGLMAQTDRRFKAVFAGLHQVQRFHDSSNTPVAHGGDDILVGPLGSLDAYHLVVDPMSALGYKFESPDLVWRLLLLTNYQASLVQIVCEALVRELRRRDLPASGGRITITSGDVESVYAKREVRDLIVQRFRWTINLDSRYRVIALVVALQSLDSEPGETFTPKELHEYCELFWPTGFSAGLLSDKEFERYLKEMVGLGVLHRQGDQYGLRSPNIISLLGDRDSLTRELDEAPQHLELQYEYNPTMNRRNLGGSTALSAQRSPLSDQDIASLLGQDGAKGGRVKIVTGSRALAIDRAAQVIQDVAAEHQIPCNVVSAEQVDSAIAGARTRRHVVVDLSGDDAPGVDLPALYARLAARSHVTATIMVGPAALPIPREIAQPSDVISARRWSIEGLRSWYESPFNSPDLRKRLYRVTSGWPLLVEQTMREIEHGKSPDDALGYIVGLLSNPEFARQHLLSCGIDPVVADMWAAAQALTGDDGLVEAFPASLEELSEALKTDASDVIEQLEALDLLESTEDGWVLDRAVLAAAAALRA